MGPTNTAFVVLGLIVTFIVVIQILYVEPSFKLHTVSDQMFLKQFMKKQFQAHNNLAILNELSGLSEPMTMDYWYMYYHIRTKEVTFYTLLNRINRFSDACNLCVYGMDHRTQQTFQYIFPTRLRDITVEESGDKITVKQPNLFEYTIDFAANRLTYNLWHGCAHTYFVMSADDWNTNELSFFPWFIPMRLLTDLKAHESHKPGEWMADSPCTGHVVEAKLFGVQLESQGKFWFDTYTGTNYHWLSPYSWFYIQNDDWIIYLLQYGEANAGRGRCSPILIKNCKENRWFYSGAINELPQPFAAIHSIVDNVLFEYSVNGGLGQSFEAKFRSRDISVTITSVPDTIKTVFMCDYYKNDSAMTSDISSEDKEYYEHIRNISFEEYLCEGVVTIEYDGKKTTTVESVLYEGMTNKRTPT